MAMNQDTGDMRLINSMKELTNGEVSFEVGELVEIKGCFFEIKNIYPNPANEIVMVGKGRARPNP